jgi:hypothetical protein
MLPGLHRSTVHALAALALCVSAAAPAAAQDQPAEFQSWRVPGWTFTPGIIVGALFDSNVAIAPTDGNGKTASDTLFQLEPSGQLAYYSARTTFSSGYQGSLRRYFDLGSLDGTDHRAFLSLRERVTRRVTIFANDNYSQVPTTDQLELNDVPFLRTGARYNLAAAGVDARVTRNTDALVRYDMTWVDFVREDTLLTGGLVNGLHGEMTHRFGDRVSAGGEYGVRLADLNQDSSQQVFQDAGGVFRYRAGSQTTFEAAGGVAHFVDRDSQITRTEPYTKLALTRRAEHATVGLAYNRTIVPSLAFGGVNQSQDARGYVQMPLDRNRFYIQESAAWRRTDPFLGTELALDSIFLNTVFGYAVEKWFRIEGYHSFTAQDNRAAAGKITRHVAGVQFVVSEPLRIR